MAAPDLLTTEVIAHRLHSTAEEMLAALVKTACSPNIKERRDCSIAIFDAPWPRYSEISEAAGPWSTTIFGSSLPRARSSLPSHSPDLKPISRWEQTTQFNTPSSYGTPSSGRV